jgi:two-component system cell cycle sensor histidine kinase/response regulator CckA
MPADRTGVETDGRDKILRALGFLLALAVAGAAYPVAMERGLSWWFWAGLGCLFASNLFFFSRKGRGSASLVFLLNTVLVGLLFVELGERAPEFFILYALTLLVAAAGRKPVGAVAATVVAVALYAFLKQRNDPAVDLLSGAFLTRIAFFYAYSLFIAYLGSEYEKAQRSARESETQFKALADALPEVVFEADTTCRITFANARGFDLFGYTEADVADGVTLLDMIVPEEQSRARDDLVLLMGGDTQRGTKYTARRKDGSKFQISIHVAPILRGGKVAGLRGIVIDMTEHDRAEQALQEERDRARTYLDVAEVMLVVLNLGGEVVHINRKGCRILGYVENELVKMNWFKTCVRAADREAVVAAFRDVVAGRVGIDEYRESHVVARNGTERLIAWHNALFRDRSGQIVGTIMSGEDITEKKRMEAQLRQAHKMEAVGQLAGGIAHDFNNLLMVMNGYVSSLLDQQVSPDEARHNLAVVLKSGERAALLTRQLLAFSRRQVLQLQSLDLNEVVIDLDKMLRRVIPENITLTTTLARDLGCAWADRGQVEQVILNLAINARDAMPDGGTLAIETANVTLDDAFQKSRPYAIKPGPYVMLAMSDTGRGMDENVKAHLFEPFYTTKPIGQGTGLGLATVYGIVKQSNGYIDVQSEKGKGATFRIYLPCATGAADEKTAAGGAGLKRGNETILLVEDMDAVRDLIREQLQTLGYTVRSACDGKLALELLGHEDGPVHLLLTDVVMPHMSGQELAQRLREIRPDVKVILMSGYPDPLDKLSPIENYMQKPISLNDLSLKIRAVLDCSKPSIRSSSSRDTPR